MTNQEIEMWALTVEVEAQKIRVEAVKAEQIDHVFSRGLEIISGQVFQLASDMRALKTTTEVTA
jgi:hypothetical protein